MYRIQKELFDLRILGKGYEQIPANISTSEEVWREIVNTLYNR
jgi:hypothetical protein